MLNPVVVDNSIRCLECSLRRDSLALSLFLAVSFAVRDKPIVDLLQSIAFPIKSRGCAHSYISAHVNRGTHSHARGFFFVSSLDRNEFIELFTITKYEWTAVRRWHAQAHNSVVATRCDFKKLYKLKSSWKSLGLRRRLHTVCVSVCVRECWAQISLIAESDIIGRAFGTTCTHIYLHTEIFVLNLQTESISSTVERVALCNSWHRERLANVYFIIYPLLLLLSMLEYNRFSHRWAYQSMECVFTWIFSCCTRRPLNVV